VRALGIDVGVDKGLDLVVMDLTRTPFLVLSHAGLDDVARAIDEAAPDIVAIDAPSAWAAGGKSRMTENQLAQLNIHAFRTPVQEHGTASQFDWMRAGFEVFALATRKGYPLFNGGPWKGRSIEVYPHATATVLAGCLRPASVRKRTWRERVLRAQGVRTDELTTLDRVDAALAALTGLLVLDGHHTYLGDLKEGVIVVPARSLPAARYRAGEDEVAATMPLFVDCACGCGRQVRPPREFARGHDAKRKSMLWGSVREGRDAEAELRRRTWEMPPETR